MSTWQIEAHVVATEVWITHVEADTRQEAVSRVRAEAERNFMPEEFTVMFKRVEEVKDSDRNHARF